MPRLPLTVVLALVGGLGSGCSQPQTPSPPAADRVQSPTLSQPIPPTPTPAPSPPIPVHAMDPAQHTIPETPVTGRLEGKAFTPDRVELEGHRLTIRQGHEFFPERSIAIDLDSKTDLREGLKRVVQPSQPWSDHILSLQLSIRDGTNLPQTSFVPNGYAMTLELGRPANGQIPGRIYLCLPGEHKSVVAGTFIALRRRSLAEPPGELEVPYIEGTVLPALKEDQSIRVGYVSLGRDGKPISDSVGSQLSGDDGIRTTVQSISFAPRIASLRFEKSVPRFDFTNLPPGRYLIYARIENGPITWKWVDLPDAGRVTTELKFDEAHSGTVEIAAPAEIDEVRLFPRDPQALLNNESLLHRLMYALDLRSEVQDGKATITHVPAGQYRIHAGILQAEVEVRAGETTALTLPPN